MAQGTLKLPARQRNAKPAKPRAPLRRRGGRPADSKPVPDRPRPVAQAPEAGSVPGASGSHPRLSKRMSELGLCSRREADEAARREQGGRVTILLNKPVGYVSGQAEEGYQPAVTLIGPETRWAEDKTPIKF